MPRSTPTSAGAYFYPRPPRGGRQRFQFIIQSDTVFLSTPSARRATHEPQRLHQRGRISIHALREEGDQREVCEELGLSISIHALREEGDAALNGDHAAPLISIHALREEGDSSISFSKRRARISIHALREEGD